MKPDPEQRVLADSSPEIIPGLALHAVAVEVGPAYPKGLPCMQDRLQDFLSHADRKQDRKGLRVDEVQKTAVGYHPDHPAHTYFSTVYINAADNDSGYKVRRDSRDENFLCICNLLCAENEPGQTFHPVDLHIQRSHLSQISVQPLYQDP